MLNNLICKTGIQLLRVMELINENAMGVCFVVDEKNKLKGVVTDGDIRRALLKNVSLHTTVNKVLNKNYVFGHEGESTEVLIKKISDKIKIIPIVNNENEVVDYFTYTHNVHFPVAIPNLNGNELKYLTDAFLSTWISSQGEYLDRFEVDFSKYCDCKYGVAVSNGTVALHLALIALGIGTGDEVIIPDLTFAATINAVLHANATPVIIDVEKDSWCIDPAEIRKAITPQTKAVIPVHIYGQPCDMGAIMSIANEHGLKVIEDCAEAHGATYNGRKVGSFGDVGCFSFYGNKVITTGEGGMCVTNSESLKDKLALLKDHGMSKEKRYWHDVVGYNYRLTNLQAAVGMAQLERIDEIHQSRQSYEKEYRKILSDKSFVFQQEIKKRGKITWLVSILVGGNIERDNFINILTANGIDARPFFYPLSSMPIYSGFSKMKNKVSLEISAKGVNLPTYESLKSINEIHNILSNVISIGIEK